MKSPIFLCAALAAAPVFAQIVVPPASDPGALQQRRIDEEQRRLQLERLERAPVTDPVRKDAPDAPAREAKPGAVRFMVREIRFTASEIFRADELSAFARDYAGRELTFADLQLLANRINAAYVDRRVVSARAVIPPQDVSGGIVEVRLVEGRLGDIHLTGNATTDSGYITERMVLQTGRLVDLPTLEQDLQRFNRTNDVQLRAELKPGSSFGTTDLQINVTEPPLHDLRLLIDNAGSDSTGEERAGVVYSNRSVFGMRDSFSLSATRAVGQESYSVAYALPINTLGGRVTLAYFKDYIDVRYGPLAPLQLTGESTGSTVSVRQSLCLKAQSQLDLLAGYKKRRSINWTSGVFLQRTDTEDFSVGAETQRADDYGFWLATYNVTSGRAYVTDRDNYVLGRGSIWRSNALGDGWSAQGNLSFQHTADRLLPASEQMIIGGEGTVRGYPVGSHAGDRGHTLALELHHPLPPGMLGRPDSAAAILARGFFFADYGRVKPLRPPNTTLRSYEELSSAGWGVNATIGKRVTARVTLTFALNHLPLEPRRYGAHFQLGVGLF